MERIYLGLIVLLAFVMMHEPLKAQLTLNETLVHDGIDRSYILYIPESYSENESYPLLLNFHGYGSSAYDQMWYGDFRPIADTAGFIIVHPMGTVLASTGETHFNVGGWTTDSAADDVGFTSALLDELEANYSIDENRIYSTGMSNGGFMSYRLACELSNRIAAIASVTGSMTPQVFDNCNPVHPTPVLQMHGTADLVVPFIGDPAWTIGIEDVMAFWANVNTCAFGPNNVDLPDDDPNDGSTAEIVWYVSCTWDAEVYLYKFTGAGHTWPGNFLGSNNTNYDVVGSVEIWNFLSQYRLDELSEVISSVESEITETDWQIVVDESMLTIRVENLSSLDKDYMIVDFNGKVYSTGRINSDHTISISNMENGIYFIKIGEQTRSFRIVN